jgi:isopentenyldiphosphate isomerase
MIVKEQFGRADVKFKKGTEIPIDYGNDLKAASTDALKKCASELGIASDIYGKNEFKEIKVVKKDKTDDEKEKNIKSVKEKLNQINDKQNN